MNDERGGVAQTGVASEWVGLSLGGLWVSAGVSVGENRPRMKTTNTRMNDVQMGVASDWVGLSLRGFWVSAGVSVGEAVHE